MRKGVSVLLAPLLLAACNDPATVTFAPTLQCAYAVRCNVIEWSLGIRYGPRLTGTHGGCHCLERPAS